MKAIETVYNGYKFRSRLEARWAVFFDTLGIEYQYEVEGYIIENAGKYLPDFFLIEDEIYIEIKPPINKQTWKRIRENPQRWLEFPNAINRKLYVFFGEPYPYRFDAFFTMKYKDNNFKWIFWRNALFILFENCMLLSIELKESDPSSSAFKKMWGISGEVINPTIITYFSQLGYDAPPGIHHPAYAYTAARQARFEHQQ